MGGAGTYASFLLKGLRNKGVETYTITTGNRTIRDRSIYRIAIPNITYWRRLYFSKSSIHLLHELNKIRKFDLVHFNEPHLITARNPNLPTVCTFHSTQLNEFRLNLTGSSLRTVENIRDLVVKNPVGHLCDIITGFMSDRIICPYSDLVKLLKYCYVDKQKIHIIPNGIDPEMFDRVDCESAFLEKHGLEKGSFVLYIGRLHSLKGVQYLIKAFQRVKREHRRLKLVVAGTGDFEPYLKRMALGVRGVLFVGYVSSLMIKKLLYENCLAVVAPSIYETFPMVVLEAMACSKPVIASNVGGIRLMIKHGKNGFLVNPKNVEELELFISKLYDDQNLGMRMGSVGRELVEKKFTIDRMTEETLKVYESLL